ncbi:transcription factor that binds to CRE motif [Sporothrix epigloea]|uniref:Transcription factor that binds to CRE motif n=1 Tax=Sporothrix epigloea TaxID=1892477 RepID=A0ABP0DYW8_9PEZI
MEAIRDTPSLPTASRQLEIKTSPTDSLLSEPSDVYPSLFCGSSVASSAAATPADTGDVDVIDFASETGAFTGSLASLAEEALDDLTPLAAADTDNTGLDTSPATGKKPTKKRKSWGQVLPEPKTNLPPRKRAKTEDEKEQRRVERVLRNRRAAQSSRERKRLEVEALEIRNRELEEQLARVRKENSMLYEQLTQAQGTSAVISAAATPVTMSQELFSSQNGCLFTAKSESGLGPLLSSATINPVSLSPALHPTPDPSNTLSSVDAQEPSFQDESAKSPRKIKMEALPEEVQIWSLAPEVIAANGPSSSIAAKLDVSPDMTHRPAATLCPDLQCLSGETSQAWTDFSVLPATKPDSFAVECGYLDSPDSSDCDYDYLAGSDAIAAIDGSEFNIDDFINADESNQPSGGESLFDDCCLQAVRPASLCFAAQIAPEDPNLQPHAGASY